MNELQIFNSEEFGDIRTVTINNEPWFVGKDVAEALGYANPKNAVPNHVLDEDKLSTQIEYAGQRRKVTENQRIRLIRPHLRKQTRISKEI